MAGSENLPSTRAFSSIQDLKESPRVGYKIHGFMYDLRSFQENTASRDRLETVIDHSYIGSPYFTDTEAAMVKGLQVSGSKGSSTLEEVIEETLKERLQRRMKKRVESEDFRVCAAHDVAPTLERVLGVTEKYLMRDKQFLGLVEKWGVELRDGVIWKGLQKKGFKPKGKK
ncbi:hypothetical protein V8E51_000275 [Hyaloscypha variabilis]